MEWQRTEWIGWNGMESNGMGWNETELTEWNARVGTKLSKTGT